MNKIKTGLKTSDRIEVIYNGRETEMSIENFKNNIRGYKVYKALLSQTGTSAPTVEAIVGDNTVGTIVWTYSIVGGYIGTLAGAFPDANKVFPIMGSGGLATITSIQRLDANTVRVRTSASGVASDGKLAFTPILIEVHN